MNRKLVRFENGVGLGPTYAARLLGIAYSTYAQYRSGRRRLQTYHANHIEALMLLPNVSITRLIEKHARKT